ncbi:MAG: K(+)-stimulated pyrophosphate-energized sodium pump, partial [Frankiaceae bacterium]|nr:K(+)-stimulated pyrophosphate-energized sodium pump [Frankiaceae bacterium]
MLLAADGEGLTDLTGGQLGIAGAIAALSVAALLVAFIFVREVLAADTGTPKMREISLAVQEGAEAYLRRQLKTLSVFAVAIPLILLLLPSETTAARIGRSVFFVIGAAASFTVGYVGMGVAVRANVRVAAAAQATGVQKATRIAFRTGGVVGMLTVGLGLLG